MCNGIELVVRIYFAGLMFFVPGKLVQEVPDNEVRVLMLADPHHVGGIVACSDWTQNGEDYSCNDPKRLDLECDGESYKKIEFQWVDPSSGVETPRGVTAVGGNWGGSAVPETDFPQRGDLEDELGAYEWITTVRQLAGTQEVPRLKAPCLRPRPQENGCSEVFAHVVVDDGRLGTCDLVFGSHGRKYIPAMDVHRGTEKKRAVSEVMVQESVRCVPEDKYENWIARLRVSRANDDDEAETLDVEGSKFFQCGPRRRCLDVSVHNLPDTPGRRNPRPAGSQALDYKFYFALFDNLGQLQTPKVPAIPSGPFYRSAEDVEFACTYRFGAGDLGLSPCENRNLVILRVLEDQSICPNGGL